METRSLYGLSDPIVAVPEPSTYAMALAGLACGGYSMWRRRKPIRLSSKWLAVGLASLACLLAAPATAAPIIDWVTVGDPGNTADNDHGGYGAVESPFKIMKYEFTNQQYADFLNSVAKTDIYSLYDASMGSDARGGITRSGASGSYSYAVRTNMGAKPVNYVSWFDAARVANWLNNGQGSGSTETGAYTLVGGQTSGTAPAKNSGAHFYIPTENQWYKAAYYKGGSASAGYWGYATQNDITPTAVTAGLTGIGSAGSTGNFANYNDGADWNGQNGNFTTVGTNGGPSAYGAFDMSGSVWEWNDLTGSSGQLRGVRGGGFASGDVVLPSSFRLTANPDSVDSGSGFRLAAVPEPSTYAMALAGLACGGYSMWRRRKPIRLSSKWLVVGLASLACLLAVPALAAPITYEMVTVGNPGNAGDTRVGANTFGKGSVAYSYQIGKYDVTIGQYTAFLNAVAATDTYSLYDARMGTDLNVAGISRTGVSGSYTYGVMNNGGSSTNRPITYVSWWDSARYANWMANGQPTGAQSSTTTENGAYNVNGATSGNAMAKNATNPNTGFAPSFYIPLESEWYKAAYYSPALNGGAGGYYAYATQSDGAPGNTIGSDANQANYKRNGLFAMTQWPSYSSSQNYLTDVGAFAGSGSFYGTFDQSGNVSQWNDLDGTAGSSRGMRGSSFIGNEFSVSSASAVPIEPTYATSSAGFRLASPVVVPEPSTYAMALAGLACGGYSMWRRRKWA